MKKFIDKITFLIVCFNSSYVIKKCIKSVNSKAKILIVENSNNYLIKKELEKEFSNVKVVIAGKNLGYGAGNNLGISKIKTPYAFIMNPDLILKKNCINELYKAVKFLENKFKILAPKPIDDFGFFFKNYSDDRFANILPVDYVKGFAMLINLKRINFRKLFDENFFLFLEEIDLCKRIHDLYGHKKEIFLVKKAKVSHVSKKSSGDNLNIKLCRDWHWMWSLYYYNNKHFGRFAAYKATVYKLILSLIKIIFSIFFMKKNNFLKYKYRIYGMLNAYLGKSSWLRPEMFHEK
jgi:N-acetylglucosaminyl-diphospho-decaprenol L-rhamnosyltransferase